MPEHIVNPFQRCLQNRGKLVLVTGPTGSGKTTTLYAALNYLRDGRSNITTIEDPIEYRFRHLNQIQINKAVDVNFASVLRAVLRQDPDIVMIGEIRDQETLSVVLQAAQTGHLVLSTVHTNDAIAALFRLLDLGAEPFQIATALSGVLAQRLVRLVCKECCRPLSDQELKSHADVINYFKIDGTALRTGTGCSACFQTGYRGRAGLYSFFEVNEQTAELIYSGTSYETFLKEARTHGFTTLEQAAVELCSRGETTLEETLPYFKMNTEQRPKEVLENVPASPAAQSNDPPSALRKPRVLIIDDNKTVRRMIAALLKREMVDVQEATNGLTALEEVYRRPPDLVICDLRMPEMDGREFLRRMQGNEKTRDIPFIVLTVDGTAENEVEFLESGACEFLSKDASPLILMTRIRRILDSVRS
jgi:CheY-like chemotaxis protein